VFDYLGHILKAVERILRYTEDMEEVAFSHDELTQDAVIRNLEIVGERAETSSAIILNSPPRISNFRWHSRTRCEIRCRMDISRLI